MELVADVVVVAVVVVEEELQLVAAVAVADQELRQRRERPCWKSEQQGERRKILWVKHSPIKTRRR